jgi:hypothetical protein
VVYQGEGLGRYFRKPLVLMFTFESSLGLERKMRAAHPTPLPLLRRLHFLAFLKGNVGQD